MSHSPRPDRTYGQFAKYRTSVINSSGQYIFQRQLSRGGGGGIKEEAFYSFKDVIFNSTAAKLSLNGQRTKHSVCDILGELIEGRRIL